MITAIFIAMAVAVGSIALHANAVYVIAELKRESEDKTNESGNR